MSNRRPIKAEFVEYARSKGIDEVRAGDQWEVWQADDWRDKLGVAIISWKGKLLTFAKQGYGMFAERRGPKRTDDEVDRKRRAARESERINREYEQRKRKQSD